MNHRQWLFCVGLSTMVLASAPAGAADRGKRADAEVLRLEAVLEVREDYARKAHLHRMEAIETAEHILRHGTLKGDARAEMMLRLAELYVEEFRRVRLLEMEAHLDALERCDCPTPAPPPAEAPPAREVPAKPG